MITSCFFFIELFTVRQGSQSCCCSSHFALTSLQCCPCSSVLRLDARRGSRILIGYMEVSKPRHTSADCLPSTCLHLIYISPIRFRHCLHRHCTDCRWPQQTRCPGKLVRICGNGPSASFSERLGAEFRDLYGWGTRRCLFPLTSPL